VAGRHLSAFNVNSSKEATMVDLQRVLRSSQLPTLPTVAMRLLELARDPESGIKEVVAVVRTDPAISAKILKAANSSFFGLRSQVQAVDRAVPLLGTTVATSLALSFSLTDDSMSQGPLAEQYHQFWMQSVVQAAAAEQLASYLDTNLAPEFFLSGLIQDIGRLALLKAVPREYLAVLNEARATTRPLSIVEIERLGFDHADIGARLLEQWKLPANLVDSVRHHHETHHTPPPVIDTPEKQRSLLAARLAGCVGDYFCTSAKGYALGQLRGLIDEEQPFSIDQLDEFLANCDAKAESAAELFHVDVTSLGDPADLMVQANEQLVQLALKEHVASTQATQRQQQVEREKEELVSQNQQLQKQAIHDPLTGLYNRLFFDEALHKEVLRCQRMAAPLGLLFADVDRFKSLNDTYGHPFGDLVLKKIAELFQSSIRSTDVLARYGGEEFVVLVSQPTEKGLEKLAERVRANCEAHTFRFGDQEVVVTCSIGAALTVPSRKDRDVAARLVSTADECLYAAKNSGRNQVQFRSLVDQWERDLMHQVTQHRFSRWLVGKQLLDMPAVSRAVLGCPSTPVRIGELGEQLGYLTATETAQVLQRQEQTGERFGAVAVQLQLLSLPQLVHLLTLQQESPRDLAKEIARLGLMPPDQVAAALQTYLSEVTPAARLAGSVAAAG
jgi:diguanylate cyclase (GGDEF)-like protein